MPITCRPVIACAYLILAQLYGIPAAGHADLVWPQPSNISSPGERHQEALLHLHAHRLHFTSHGHRSSLLQEAFQRYRSILLDDSYPAPWPSALPLHAPSSRHGRHAIHCIAVHVWSSDQSLGLQTSESYTLTVAAPTTTIEATTVYGALRALETLAQLVTPVSVGKATEKALGPDVVEALVAFGENAPGIHHRHRRRHKTKTLFLVNETYIFYTIHLVFNTEGCSLTQHATSFRWA